MRTAFKYIFITLLYVGKANGQCSEVAIYNNGKFRVIQYDSLWNPTLLPTEYLKFNQFTKAVIEKENKRSAETGNPQIKDSSGICGNLYLNLFSSGNKNAIFNVYGKQLSDFKYDDLFTYLPATQNRENKYTKFDIWKQYFFARNKNTFALISDGGKELTPFNYGIPYLKINSNYDHCDTVIFTAMNTLPNSDSLKCGDCLKESNILYFPLAGNSIILTKSNKLGSIDSSGKTIIPFIYDKIKIYKGVVETATNSKQVIYSLNGNEISGFDEIHPIFLTIASDVYTTGEIIFSGIYAVKQKEKWGFTNGNKNEIVKCIFEEESLVFDSATDTYSFLFIHKKEGITVEIKNQSLKLIDDNGKDISQKYIQKYSK